MGREVLEFLANLHGVTFDAQTSDEDLQKALTEAVKGGGTGEGGTPPPTSTPPPTTATGLPATMQHALAKMAEDNESVKALLAEFTDSKRRIAELEGVNRLSEVRRKMGEVGNARRVLSPHISEKLSELVAAMPPKAGNAVLEIIKEVLTDSGTVELGERGRSAVDSSRDAGTRFNTEVQKLMEADENLGYADAVSKVSSVNPDLFDAYRQSATSEWR